jgi:hypothetical protein
LDSGGGKSTDTTAATSTATASRRRSNNRYSGGDEDTDHDDSSVPQITWIHVPGDHRHHYIASLDWIPDSNELVFQRLNRLQNTVHVVIAELSTGSIRIAWTDRDEAWIDLQSAAWYGGEIIILH